MPRKSDNRDRDDGPTPGGRPKRRTAEPEATDSHLLHALASVSPVGILRADPKRLCIYVNSKWCDLSGLTPRQSRGRGWLRAFHPDDRHRVFADWEQADLGKRAYRSEFRFQRPDGESTWLYGQAIAERDDSGEITGYIGTITDISERKRSENELRTAHNKMQASEELFRTLLESAPDGVVVFDRDGVITLVNHRAIQMFGYERDAFIGLEIKALLANADSGQDLQPSGQPGDPETRLELSAVRQDGGTFTAEIHLNPIRVGGRDSTILIVRDLTERLKEIEAQLELAALVDASEDAIITTTMDGFVTSWSKGAERTYGYSAEEMMGQSMTVLFPEDAVSQREDAMNQVAEGKRFALTDVVRVRKDGRLIDVSVSLSPVRDKNGQITGITGVTKDVSEQKLLERQFHEAQKMEAVGRLAGGIAHDFNNLLTVVTGYSEMLGEGMSPNHPARLKMAAIGRAAQQAADLTRRLLAFGRKQPVEPKVLNLNQLITEMTPMLGSIIGEAVEIESHLAVDLRNVEVDQSQLEQVVINLVTNARDAMPLGGRLTIETSDALAEESNSDELGVRPGNYTMLSITDTGIGMDADTMSHIFEPFFTTKEHGKGTGLGLATSYGTVRQCGGSITVRGAPEQGATFEVYLPSVDKPVATPVAPATTTTVPKLDASVLIVEDDDALRQLASEILSSAGYTVTDAVGPQQALAQMEDLDPDLVLTDVIMPHMTGPEMVDQLVSSGRNVKVLYMSGYTSNALEGRTSILNEDILQKPFTPTQLLRRVAEALAD